MSSLTKYDDLMCRHCLRVAVVFVSEGTVTQVRCPSCSRQMDGSTYRRMQRDETQYLLEPETEKPRYAFTTLAARTSAY